MADDKRAKARHAAHEDRDDQGGVLLAHPGTDDATQRRIDPGGPNVSALARDQRRGAAQDGGVSIVDDTVAGRQYDTELDAMRPYLEGVPEELYRKQYLLLPSVDGYVTTDCTNDVVYAALNAGFRPVGDAHLEGAVDHPDGLHKVVTWAVPVQSAREVDGDKAAEVRARLSDEGSDVKDAADRDDPVVGFRRGEHDTVADGDEQSTVPVDKAAQPRTGGQVKRDRGE